MLRRPLAAAPLALLVALSAAAQNVRVGTVANPVSPVPVIGGALGIAPVLETPGVSGFSFAPSLVPSLAAPSIDGAPTALAAPVLAEAVVPAAAKPQRPGNAPKAAKLALEAPVTPADGWASRFNFTGGQLFDGSRSITSEAGAVFTAVPKGEGAVRVHIIERGPLAGLKPVGGTEGLSGKPLLEALNSLTGRGYRQHEYKEASNYLFATADHVTVNGVSGVVDAYSGIFVPGKSGEGGDYHEPGDDNGDGYPDREGMNVEHTWPQSKFQKALPMRSDLHHLMATFMHPNSVRGNLPFGVVTGTPDYENKAGAKRGNGVFEPPDAVKGRVARGLLYFYARYKDSRTFGRESQVFWNQQIELMLEWNRRFPPDAFEARRNDLVEQWQGNRNPFIDDYTLADRIGADALRAGGPTRMNLGVKQASQGRGRRGRRSARR